MGWGVTFTSVTAGFDPVTAPVLSTGKTVWAMNTFQDCPDWLLGSPVAVEALLTLTGAVQLRHPLLAEAALTNTCRSEGVSLSMAQTTNRLRALSNEATENSTSGEPGRLFATWIMLSALPFGCVASGAS